MNVLTIFEWEGGGEGGGKEDGYCVHKDEDGVQLMASSTITVMTASALMPETVVNDGDWGMEGWTLSKDLMAPNDKTKRTVLAHLCRWIHAARGHRIM